MFKYTKKILFIHLYILKANLSTREIHRWALGCVTLCFTYLYGLLQNWLWAQIRCHSGKRFSVWFLNVLYGKNILGFNLIEVDVWTAFYHVLLHQSNSCGHLKGKRYQLTCDWREGMDLLPFILIYKMLKITSQHVSGWRVLICHLNSMCTWEEYILQLLGPVYA